MLLDVGPAGGLRQVEDILHGVELHHIDVGLLALRDQLSAALLELVRDELEEDQREDDMLIFGRLHRAPQLSSRLPKGFFKGFLCLSGGLLFSKYVFGKSGKRLDSTGRA